MNQASILQLPVEPLYTTAIAAELVPFPSTAALLMFVGRHKNEFPQRYRRTRWYEERMFTESEIVKMREMTVFGPEHSRYHTGYPRPGGPRKEHKKVPTGILATIFNRAMSNA